ncbi:Uma2 family endonuclease [bacterium]|nr:Uma2 family endonuclease [bacterium]
MGATVEDVAQPRRKSTYDDVIAAPEHRVAEIVDGELVLSPRPSSLHARATAALLAGLFPLYDGESGGPARPGGWWILFEPEIHVGSDVLVPDVAGWRRERMPRLPRVPWFEAQPDWICETLSPATARLDRTRKLEVYARAGVVHAWLLDPIDRSLEVLVLDSDRWRVASRHRGKEVASPEPFPDAELDLGRLWID